MTLLVLIRKRWRRRLFSRGITLCQPCGHLEHLTKPGVEKGLMDRAGLNVEILNDGVIRVGDPVVVS